MRSRPCLFHGADFLSVFDKQRLDAMAMLFLDLHGAGLLIAWNFGLWFFPLGLLVYRSGFPPRSRRPAVRGRLRLHGPVSCVLPSGELRASGKPDSVRS